MLSVRPRFSYFVLDTCGMIQIKKRRVLLKTNGTPQEIIKRNIVINQTKSLSLDFVRIFMDGVGQFSFCAWQSRFLQPVQESVQIQGQQLLHSQVFLSCIRSLKAFCLNESVEANLAQQNSLPTFSSLFESFRYTVHSGKKSLIWRFYEFSKFLFTHASKTLYSSDKFLNTRYIMDAAYLFMDRKARPGLQTCIF